MQRSIHFVETSFSGYIYKLTTAPKVQGTLGKRRLGKAVRSIGSGTCCETVLPENDREAPSVTP